MRRLDLPKNKLKKLYLDEGKSSLEIARIFDCSWLTIVNYLRKYNLPVRNHSEKTLNAFKTGKMDFMPKVWNSGRKRWCKSGNPRWKPIGSKRFSHGYVLIKIAENKGFKNWVEEHRYKMEQKLGRKLYKKEIIHHKNGVRSDNRLSNLIVMSDKSHRRFHLKDNLHKS